MNILIIRNQNEELLCFSYIRNNMHRTIKHRKHLTCTTDNTTERWTFAHPGSGLRPTSDDLNHEGPRAPPRHSTRTFGVFGPLWPFRKGTLWPHEDPHGPPRPPKRHPRDHQGPPKTPKDSQKMPKDPQGTSKGLLRPERPWGSPGELHKSLKSHKAVYMYKRSLSFRKLHGSWGPFSLGDGGSAGDAKHLQYMCIYLRTYSMCSYSICMNIWLIKWIIT